LSLIIAFAGKCPKKQEVQFNDEEEENNGPIDVKSNIFLNGNFASSSAKSESSSSSSSSGVPQGFHTGAKIDLSNNPFLQGGFAHAGNVLLNLWFLDSRIQVFNNFLFNFFIKLVVSIFGVLCFS